MRALSFWQCFPLVFSLHFVSFNFEFNFQCIGYHKYLIVLFSGNSVCSRVSNKVLLSNSRKLDTAQGDNLLRALKDWRKRTADELQRPIYRVMSNQLLEDIARLKPRTVDNLAALNGVGPFTLRQYGKKVIALVQQNAPEIDDRIQGVNTDAFWDSIKAQKKPKKSAKKGSEAELEAKKKELQMKKAKRRQLQVMTEEAIAELEAENTVDIEELNSEQRQASTHILQGNNVFVTGSAGTGKVCVGKVLFMLMMRL